ncbi:paraquat-inducible protein A [Ferrimonas lipolytica]|uniref:Paraquat-inducible protein A n=1 Tax=Ferrimonas lipolytica TaxID=2724191 RepID=A0A6H1UDY9_9GAMM|nr:paraquat-inducible protein A [Ferrimonas lipolytica]QIZ76553.1 paraquat-inducible protein A [Ferrimonas lipolytica]
MGQVLQPSTLLCPTCDEPIRYRALPHGVRALCPRCGSSVYHQPHCDANTLLALTIAALVLFFPANLLPILEIDIVGNVRSTTVFSGAIAVIEKGFALVGLAVLVTGVIAPLLLLVSVMLQLLLVKSRLYPNVLKWLLLKQSLLKSLSMVEIYLISYLIAVFKLADFATLTFGWGTGCYVMLFVMLFYVQYEYNPNQMWQYYEESR